MRHHRKNAPTSRPRSTAARSAAPSLPKIAPVFSSQAAGDDAGTGRRNCGRLYGDRPPARQLRLVGFQPKIKGALRGFCTVELLPLGLRIIDCPVLVSRGKAWCALPSKPQIDSEGRLRKDINGKAQYVALVEWASRELRDRFSNAVIELIRARHPGALDD
jgi:hypothetical protein